METPSCLDARLGARTFAPVELYDLARNDVPGALAYYGQRRGRLGQGATPERQTTVSQLLRLQDEPGPLAAELRRAYPADFEPADLAAAALARTAASSPPSLPSGRVGEVASAEGPPGRFASVTGPE